MAGHDQSLRRALVEQRQKIDRRNQKLILINSHKLTSMKRLEKKHPLAIRWLHWVNFPLLFLMIWSGLLIYWANAVYRIGYGEWTLLKFFPAWFYEALGIPFRLAEGMALHFFFMWFFILNGVLYVSYTALSGEWRHLLPNRRSFKEAIQVTLHDLRLSKYHPPQRKFNGAQQIAYTSVILMGAGSVLTGLAIYKPIQFGWLTRLLGGYECQVGALLVDDQLPALLRRPHRASRPRRVEQLPRDGHRLRGRANRGCACSR